MTRREAVIRALYLQNGVAELAAEAARLRDRSDLVRRAVDEQDIRHAGPALPEGVVGQQGADEGGGDHDGRVVAVQPHVLAPVELLLLLFAQLRPEQFGHGQGGAAQDHFRLVQALWPPGQIERGEISAEAGGEKGYVGLWEQHKEVFLVHKRSD